MTPLKIIPAILFVASLVMTSFMLASHRWDGVAIGVLASLLWLVILVLELVNDPDTWS